MPRLCVLSHRAVAGWVLAVAAGLAVIGYVAVLAWLFVRQESLLFRPVVLPAEQLLATEADLHELTVDVPGARLSVLQLRLPQPRGVVFFLHGNNANLATWFVNTALYRQANLDLVMLDYRGYGKSSGQIESEAQLMDDVRAVWRTVAPRYLGLQRVIYGRSLGSGLAAQLAAELQPELTVLVSPYTSMLALAREHYPLVPGFVVRYPLRTDLAVPRIHTPLLLVHGLRDDVIDARHSRALQALAPQAGVLLIDGASHADIHQSAAYLDGLRRALAEPASVAAHQRVEAVDQLDPIGVLGALAAQQRGLGRAPEGRFGEVDVVGQRRVAADEKLDLGVVVGQAELREQLAEGVGLRFHGVNLLAGVRQPR
jgi:pimeloyl-ACP methyl ester carboxylesterase